MNKIDADTNLNLRIRSLSSGCMQDMARQYCCLVGAHLAKLNASRTFTGREDMASVRKRFLQQVYNVFHEQGLTFKKPVHRNRLRSLVSRDPPPPPPLSQLLATPRDELQNCFSITLSKKRAWKTTLSLICGAERKNYVE